MSELVLAPWTPVQVENLNLMQLEGRFHGYTCGNDDHEQHQLLIATTAGWVCPDPACWYFQNWAHAWSAE